MSHGQLNGHDVLFFDGVCGLCNGLVDFVIIRNKDILFSPLQSEYAREKLPNELISALDTVAILTDKGEILTRSQAVIYLLRKLGHPWKLASYFPAFLIEFFYKIISKNRYKLFGKRETCRLPSDSEKKRFIL